MKKSGKLASHMLTVQISLGIVVLFEKIYCGESILTVFFVSVEELQHRVLVKSIL
jgi:hypothetical protein